MIELKDKIKIALDESRMLVLGTQILLGFQFRVVFEPAFDQLPTSSKLLKMTALMVLLIAIALIMAPGSYHRIVRGGSDAEDVHQFATTMMDVALVPFVVAFALDIYLALGRILGTSGGVLGATLVGMTALFFWYGFGWLSRSRRDKGNMAEKLKVQRTSLKTKIDQALTEARVVLPGAQALLGFQLVTIFMDGFDKLPNSSKFIHIGSLGLIALTTILLMSPAAYHRIAERGEDTKRFHKVASTLLLAAMITLPLGICGDLYVVVYKITNSVGASVGCAALALAFFYGTWFGYTSYKRAQIERAMD
jgi:DMSO reductase anchor subunit